MASIAKAWESDVPCAEGRELVQAAAPVLAALANGDAESASIRSGLNMSPYLAEASCRSTWNRRVNQIKDSPADAPWVTRLLVDTTNGNKIAIGRAGFHGPPDETGMVEVGYEVDPEHRRKGHARAAMWIMMDIASKQPDVTVIRATFQPTNTASGSLIKSLGFQHRGEQWDDEDGRELIFELDMNDIKQLLQQNRVKIT